VFAGFGDVQGVRDLELTCVSDPRMTVEAAQQQLLNRLGGRAEPARPAGGNPSITAGVDEADRMREAGVQILLARCGDDRIMARADAERARQGNPFLNCSLIAMAERFLIRAGVNTRDMDRERSPPCARRADHERFPDPAREHAAQDAARRVSPDAVHLVALCARPARWPTIAQFRATTCPRSPI
jgi:hypothetical protein